MTVKEIIQKYLKENGYDGLCDDNCGCSIDDICLMEDGTMENCIPAYWVSCRDCKKMGTDECQYNDLDNEPRIDSGCFQPTKPEAPCKDK